MQPSVVQYPFSTVYIWVEHFQGPKTASSCLKRQFYEFYLLKFGKIMGAVGAGVFRSSWTLKFFGCHWAKRLTDKPWFLIIWRYLGILNLPSLHNIGIFRKWYIILSPSSQTHVHRQDESKQNRITFLKYCTMIYDSNFVLITCISYEAVYVISDRTCQRKKMWGKRWNGQDSC